LENLEWIDYINTFYKETKRKDELVLGGGMIDLTLLDNALQLQEVDATAEKVLIFNIIKPVCKIFMPKNNL
jgi:hypothetical protein